MNWDSLLAWQGPLAALLLSLGWAAVFRRRPGLAALGLPLGVVLGFALILGIGLASPRQIFERLPGLAVAGLVLALPLAFTASRAVLGAMLVLGVALTGWWMAGAPMVAADAMRAAPVLLAVGLLAALLLGELGGPWRAVAAAALLAAVLGVARPPGPILLLGATVAAACAGAMLAGRALAPGARLPLALAMAGVMAGPVLARGGPADWVVATGPLALLLLAPRLAGGLRGWRVLPAWLGVAAAVLGAAWFFNAAG